MRVALVGVHGFGVQHRRNLARLQAAGRVELVAVADPNPPGAGELDPMVRVYPDLGSLLAGTPGVEVVIVATPIQTHGPLALAALAAGADVYLEKPPVASLAGFEELLAAAAAAGRSVQVGFQSLGSHALPAIASLIASGELGRVRAVTATGLWVRDRAYFRRSRWAGQRSLDGTDVVDGVATNALAHAVATALSIAGARRSRDIESVTADLYRAHEVQSDDTSVIRLTQTGGPAVTCALTLCAAEQSEPFVTVHGTEATATFYYTTDILDIAAGTGTRRETFGRTDLLENLLEHRQGTAALLSPLENTGAFMRALEAVRTADDPRPVNPAWIDWTGDGEHAHPVIRGIEHAAAQACTAQATFTELQLPWTTPPEPAGSITIDGRTVAELQDGSRIQATSSPRPYLHPVRTLGGIILTDHQPLDHVWHLGVGVAIQDVGGVNIWGGRTFTREAGAYVWRDDHGSVRLRQARENANSRTELLDWRDPDGTVLLTEERTWTWARIDDKTWRLTLNFTLAPAGEEPVLLGSPGSNGREGGGYGGFFWRFPSCRNIRVRTPEAAGEEAVHGAVAPWLTWEADFDGGPASVLFLAPPEAPDPWFVRSSGYPGAGSALAWDASVEATRTQPVTRTITMFMVDGALSTTRIEELRTQK